jgi:DNA polymerase-1
MKVTIVTGDRDALQIATKKIRIAIPHKGYQEPEYLDDVGVEAKYGVTPEQIPAYKGLTGDSSDNLPGVKGIGPKTAAQLIQDYGSLNGIYEHLADIKEGVRAKLEADRESAFFCEHMATLVCDIPMPVTLEDAALKSIAVDPVLELFKTLEFNTLSKRYQSLATSDYGVKHFVAPTMEAPKAPIKKPLSESQPSLF